MGIRLLCVFAKKLATALFIVCRTHFHDQATVLQKDNRFYNYTFIISFHRFCISTRRQLFDDAKEFFANAIDEFNGIFDTTTR